MRKAKSATLHEMMNFDKMTLEELTNPQGFDGCACGRKHECPMEFVAVAPGALSRTVEMVQKLGGTYPYVICDKNTYEAAGKRVLAELEKAGIPYKLCMLKGERPAPDEKSVGSATMHLDKKCDLILSVGGGVINDTGKIVGFMTGKKQAVIGTAPSMDGYASDSGAMEIDDVKCSIYVNAPAGILLDIDVLKEAPMRMLWAGYGDIIAKYTGVLEWRISALVHGDYYCEEVSQLMRAAVKKVEDHADGIATRDPEAVQAIAEGLVLAGIAMSFAKISRPASGLEHSLSHLWEMMALERKRPYDLHGIQVAVGTVINLKIFEKLKKTVPDKAKAEAFMASFDENEWKAEMRRIFGNTTEEILAIEEKTGKNVPARHAMQLSRTLEHWDEILRMMDEELPNYKATVAKMRRLGMPVTPSDIGISVRDAVDAFIGAREIKDKYMINNTIWDLGLTKEFQQYLEEVVESDEI